MIIINTSNNNTQLKNPIKESILASEVHGWWATLSDWLTKFCFGDMPVMSPIVQHIPLSDMITNLFESTKIAVYVYDSKVINCFTMIGISNMATPLTMRLQNTKLKNITNYIGNFEKMFNLMQTLFGTKGSVTELVYNKATNKYILPIPEVSIYISNALIDLLNNDDEIIAILLSEVGQNLQICSMYVSDVLFKTSFITTTFGSLLYISQFVLKWVLEGTYWENLNFGKINNFLFGSVCTLGIISLFSYFIAIYMKKKRQIYSDKFAALVGYAEPFYSAIKKIHNYMFASSIKTDAVKGLNIIDRILHFIDKILSFFGNIGSLLGINSKLSTYARERNALKNISKVNDNNIQTNTINENNNERFDSIMKKINNIKNKYGKKNNEK